MNGAAILVMEDLLEKAAQTLKKQMESDFDKGYKHALDAMISGKLELRKVEWISEATMDELKSDLGIELTEAYLEGYKRACKDALKRAEES